MRRSVRSDRFSSLGGKRVTDLTFVSFGPSVGYNPYKNLWMSVGWNVTGFQDRDFVGADDTRRVLT